MGRGISAEEMQEKIDKVRNFECPKCGAAIGIVPAVEVETSLFRPGERLRKCTECTYWHYLCEDQDPKIIEERKKEQSR